ncbi:helix-turn-helix transcriptional regulator [Streptomyces hebeiensis]
MEDFGDHVKAALKARGMSMRSAAERMHYDVSYLSRVINGRQTPSEKLARALDQLLGTGGAFMEMLTPPSSADEAAVLARESVTHLLDHDSRYGADHIASAAVQVWRSEQRRVNASPSRSLAHLSAVSELAEIAGWLLFDANRQDEARQAFVESHLLAQQAGDKQMQWFALDLLAMQDVQCGRPGEALSITDELLTRPNLPPRVALLARTRRARALAQAGDRARSLADVERALGALEDSISLRDPAWAWWVTEPEIVGHWGEVLLSLGDHSAAIPHLQQASSAMPPEGRGTLYYAVAELTAFSAVGAWRECEVLLQRVATILETVSSSRSRARFRSAIRTIRRDGPGWLSDVAVDVAA